MSEPLDLEALMVKAGNRDALVAWEKRQREAEAALRELLGVTRA